jgi:GNAT superfamily N-acetyltransferase
MTYKQEYADIDIGEYTLTACKKKCDLQYVYNLICLPSRYSTGLPPERFALVIENSVCFSVFHQGKQMAFARVITDFTEFASLWDVFVDEPHRGKGIGKAIMKYVLEHPRLKGIFRWFLMTEDAHGLYQKYGFKSEAYNPYVMMKVSSSN